MKTCPKCNGSALMVAPPPREWWVRAWRWLVALVMGPAKPELVQCRVCLGAAIVEDELELVDTPEAWAELKAVAAELRATAKRRLPTAAKLMACPDCGGAGVVDNPETGAAVLCQTCHGKAVMESPL